MHFRLFCTFLKSKNTFLNTKTTKYWYLQKKQDYLKIAMAEQRHNFGKIIVGQIQICKYYIGIIEIFLMAKVWGKSICNAQAPLKNYIPDLTCLGTIVVPK